MRISIPRERKSGESRVAITPNGVAALVAAGHRVLIETKAGMKSGYLDSAYETAGASLAKSLEEVWTSADLLVKVKEPHPEEYQFFRKNLALFCFLHPAAEELLTKTLIKKGVTAFDYDLLTSKDGTLPILYPMSVIAGKLSIQCGARALESVVGGRGVLLGGATGAKPARVLVVGCGAAGSNAGMVAAGMGADVVLLDLDVAKVERFIAESKITARAESSTAENIAREAAQADLIIGAVLVPGDLAPKLITKGHLSEMKPGAALVDICIDQGGFAESSKAMTLEAPTYSDENVVHYCVPNMPALVPRTATKALTYVTLPWITRLANGGIEAAMNDSYELRSSLVCHNGELTNEVVGKALGLETSS